ncbi:probable serine/threonine-protein kinase DDB_G0282963 isoform X2 [Trichoplusia ni]|uniref:Probable serine/threonine-protein kinase DDB_G0282963 isoform X2 n=1 Tax=Trichoplusia ni TaxID=7111 RepID=A0A7E5VME5_TRINI|nr:probable serine/threonine-protein kinase DDB_G0282963 isoform X2 [Trichoplusia ni]
MMSKVILFGVLIFYSNFGVSVSYTDELAVQREYWPSDWSGNEHPRRQFRSDGFAQTRHENHARPVNNQEYNDQAIRSAHTNHYNNNKPAVQPVPDKQLLPNFGSPEFKREVAPQLQRETHDQTYPRYVDRFEVKPNNEPIRNQNWKSQVHHQSTLSPNHEQKSYIPPTGGDYHGERNTHPINVEYDNQAETENISNNRHISNQARPSRPNVPIPYLNFDRSNSEATNLEEHKYIETSTPPNYSNYKHPEHSEILENSRRKSNDRKHNVGRNDELYLIPTYLEDRIENNNVAPHGYEVSEKTVPDSVTEPQNRIYIDNDEISKNIGTDPVSTHTAANLATANLAEKHKFITIDRSGSEYLIPVLPLNKYDNNSATKYVLARNPQDKDSFVADKVPSNYHESVINNARSSNDAVKHVNKYIPENIADDEKIQRSEPVRSHHTPSRVVSNNLRNNHPIMRQLQNDNNERGSGIRELITGDVNNKSESNGYPENPGQWDNIPTDSHNNVQKFNNGRNSEARQVITPAQKYNNLPLPHNVRHISNDEGSFRKLNSQPIYRPEHNRHIDDFRPRFGNHDSVLFTHDSAPTLTNNVNNHENSRHNIVNNNNNENNGLVTPGSQYIPVNGRPIESYNNGFVNPQNRPNKPNDNIPTSHQRKNQIPNSRIVDNPNNAAPELGNVEKKPESIKYFDNDKTEFAYPGLGPFRTYNEAFEAILELQGNKNNDPIYTDGFEPITPNRELTFVDTYDKSLPKHDIPSNLKSGDDETFNINGAPNVPSNTANPNVEKILPKQENYNLPGPALLQPDSDIPSTQQIAPQTPAEEQGKQKHSVLVLPDGTLEDVNKDENTQVSKNPKDILNSDVKEEKVMEKANEVQFPKQVKTLITTATPVPTETDISENNLKINEEFGIKEHQQEPPVESPPIDKTVLNSAAKRLPEDENAVVTTPYPYVTTEFPLERAPDNVYDDLVVTTVSPMADSENDEEGKAKEVVKENNDVISIDEPSQSKELPLKPTRGNNDNNNNEPPTADVVTRGDNLTNEDRRVISGIPGGKRLVSKPTPNGLKFLLDPINVSDEDTITIAIELSEAPDFSKTSGNQAARFRPRNNNNNKKSDDGIEPLYILPVEQLPVMEKETVVTQYPNGTIVTVITEVVYDNFEGTPPKVTRTEKIAELNG